MEEKKDYYVYVYLNQLKEGEWSFNNINFKYQPFYVGKGRNKRERIHLSPCLMKAKTYKNSIIKNIISKTGEEPIHYRIFEDLTNEEAIKIEIEFIKFFGRLDNKTGILTNGTDGGDGANNFSSEVLKKIGNPKKKVYQYDLEGNFIKEWESMSSVNITKHVGNLSTAIKRNGTFMSYLWSHDKHDKLSPKIKYQMPIKFVNIQQINKKTNELIKTFDNVKQIEKELKITKHIKNKIYDCLNNKAKTAYGYKWVLK